MELMFCLFVKMYYINSKCSLINEVKKEINKKISLCTETIFKKVITCNVCS